MISTLFFRKSCPHIIWRMRFVRWITTATDTHSEYQYLLLSTGNNGYVLRILPVLFSTSVSCSEPHLSSSYFHPNTNLSDIWQNFLNVAHSYREVFTHSVRHNRGSVRCTPASCTHMNKDSVRAVISTVHIIQHDRLRFISLIWLEWHLDYILSMRSKMHHHHH